MTGELAEVPLAAIKLSTTEAQKARRKRFDKNALAELAESVKTHGVLQPIIVRRIAGDEGGGITIPDRLQLVAGERRYVAAKAAGLEAIPAVVRELTDEQVIEIQLIENLQRADVHPMEEAEGYQQLMKHGHAVEELHARVGKSRSYVYGRLKLLALCKPARKAFYADEISASVALLLARIPVDKLQREALTTVAGRRFGAPMSYQRAKDVVHDHYMLRLRGAPFPTADAELVPAAGACNTCPKRTGNQPELFGDVQGADVCTDPVCFTAKGKAAGVRKVEAAKASGQRVIDGKEARSVAYYDRSVEHDNLRGYHLVSGHAWKGSQRVPVRKIIGKDAATALLRDPHTGHVHEVASNAVLDKALGRRRTQITGGASSSDTAQRNKAKVERAFRAKLYEAVRPKLAAPAMALTARALYDELDHECQKIVARLQGWDAKDVPRRLTEARVAKLTAEQVRQLVNDCIYAPDLQVFTWSTSKPERLLAAAKGHKVNAAAVRRSVTTKKKAAKKKPARKKPGTKKKRVGAKAGRKKRSKKKAAPRARKPS